MKVGPTVRGNQTISSGVLDSASGETVPVIASFDDKGKIAPLYLRIKGDSHKVLRYSILNKSTVSMVVYECMVEDKGFMKPLILKYYIKERVWLIPEDQRYNMFDADYE